MEQVSTLIICLLNRSWFVHKSSQWLCLCGECGHKLAVQRDWAWYIVAATLLSCYWKTQRLPCMFWNNTRTLIIMIFNKCCQQHRHAQSTHSVAPYDKSLTCIRNAVIFFHKMLKDKELSRWLLCQKFSSPCRLLPHFSVSIMKDYCRPTLIEAYRWLPTNLQGPPFSDRRGKNWPSS